MPQRPQCCDIETRSRCQNKHRAINAAAKSCPQLEWSVVVLIRKLEEVTARLRPERREITVLYEFSHDAEADRRTLAHKDEPGASREVDVHTRALDSLAHGGEAILPTGSK